MKDSEAFEHRIHRIHELLECAGALVTWNDRVVDPDNPSQQRQIDITITRDGKLTLVECRQHKTRQDVQWIEELIGRRLSLEADSIIAVSSTGFTAGALKKAKRHGIITRDFSQLTDLEVKSWGRQVALTLYFYQYSDLKFSLSFKRESISKLDPELVRSEFTSCLDMQSFFDSAAEQLGSLTLISEEHAGQTVEFNLFLQRDGFQLAGEPVLGVNFRGQARLISKEVVSPAILGYGRPEHSSVQREVVVETFSLGETSIVHNAAKISVFLDVTQLEIPPFCQFRFFRLAGFDEMDHEAIELAGLDKLRVQADRMDIDICPI
jgi:hypothetical protein